MPERLTESLIRRGLLDAARAREAMQRQVLLGGALDTCLLELSMVDEPALLDAMAGAYGLATASVQESLSGVDSGAVRAFPEQWAKKHAIAPIALDASRGILTVISPAPPDVSLLVRLGELLELTIKPLLAPEFRVHQRIALLYEDPAPDRFRALIERMGGPNPSGVHARAQELSQPVILARPLTFGEAITRLKDARDRDDIVFAALAYAHRELEFVAMFRVHDQRLEGWNALGERAQNIQDVALALTTGSAFRVVLDTQAHYLGPLPSDDLHKTFLEKLGRPHPRAALIVPVRIRNRTVALMYGENGPRTIPPRLAADLMLFTTHVQGALEALLVRRKTETLSEKPASAPPEPAVAPVHEPEAPLVAPSAPGLSAISGPSASSGPSIVPIPSMIPEPSVTPVLAISAPPSVPLEPVRAPAQRRPSSLNSAWPSMIPSPPPLPPRTAPAKPASELPPPPAASVALGGRIDLVPARTFELPLKLERDNDDAGTEYVYVRRTEPLPIASDGPIEGPPSKSESTDALAIGFQPSAGAAESPARADDDWDSVEIEDTGDIPSAPEPPAVPDETSVKDALESMAAMIAERTDGSALLDELDSLPIDDSEPEPTPTVPMRPRAGPVQESSSIESVLAEIADLSAQALEGKPEPAQGNGSRPQSSPPPRSEPDGWDSVQVDAWDEWAKSASSAEEKGKQALGDTMRASLVEDSTIPDLSAEAWLRASSDSIRARPVAPEVRERAAMEVAEEPVPLTKPLRPRPSAPIPYAEDSEPVPLTRPSSVVLRAEAPVIRGRPLEAPIVPSAPMMPSQAVIDFRPEEGSPQALMLRAEPPSAPQAPAPEPVVHRPSMAIPVADTAIDPAPPLMRQPTPVPMQREKLELEVNHLLDTITGGDLQSRRAARDALSAMGPFVLPLLIERFPGPIAVDPFSPTAILPPFAECGELLSILATFGLDAHPYVVRRLDGPVPAARFFATYFYAVVFVAEAIPRLVQRLHDEEPRICMLAARTLFSYRELPEFASVIEHLHGRLIATSIAARRHAAYLVGLFRDVTSIPLLIDIFDRKEKLLFEAAEGALAEITKQRLGPNPKKWRAWWVKNQRRSRIGWLVEGLASKESALRRSAAEELRAVTGLDLGYNEDAPKRDRDEARMRWAKWWSEQEARLGVVPPADVQG